MGLDWGSVPDWLAFVLALVIALVTFLNRERVARFIRRNVTEPPEILNPASIESLGVSWDGSLSTAMVSGHGGVEVLNHGPGAAYNVRIVPSSKAGLRVSSPNHHEQLEAGERWTVAVSFEPASMGLAWEVEWDEVGGVQRAESFALNFL